MDKIVVKPRFLPRGILDLLTVVAVGLVQLILLLLLPTVALIAITHSFAAGVAAYLALYLTWLAFSVTRLEFDESGVHFRRWLGSPKSIPWDQLESIEVAPTAELVVRGWLWPLFPAREMTFSLTSRGHYRFRYAGGFSYFPPRDQEQFLALVTRYRRNVA